MVKKLPICSECGGLIRKDAHRFLSLGVCGTKCEKVKLSVEEVEALRYLKEGINAVGYRHLATRSGPYKRSLIIPDTHFPFASEFVIKKIIETARDLQPYFIVQIGDLYDFYAASRFPRLHDLMTPDEERLRGRIQAEQMWEALHKVCPKAKKIQMLGNHDDRPMKRVMEKLPELAWAFDINYMFEFPQVETLHDTTQELILDGVLYQHGHMKMGAHVEYNLMDTVHGHTHRGGLVYRPVRNQSLWELDAGCAGDFASKPLQYNPRKWVKWTNGYGIIEERGPNFIKVDAPR